MVFGKFFKIIGNKQKKISVVSIARIKQTTMILNFSNPSIFTYERADIKLVYNQSAVSSAKVDGI